jgi:hypothetical protein
LPKIFYFPKKQIVEEQAETGNPKLEGTKKKQILQIVYGDLNVFVELIIRIHFSRRKNGAVPSGILLQATSSVQIEESSIFRCGDKII